MIIVWERVSVAIRMGGQRALEMRDQLVSDYFAESRQFSAHKTVAELERAQWSVSEGRAIKMSLRLGMSPSHLVDQSHAHLAVTHSGRLLLSADASASTVKCVCVCDAILA